ncbi:pleckstrin homology domain-containing family H member 3 isoform X2 [Pelobates cultripes]|uniref:Pleckstrin homology domain-containing family H member 3 isoform X2 n=1 Tax=Pelobates cultripes TaxID=61616 RepID=A0AAD1SN83_PELCU|nr:pleckstrin homology domain-containing family H member 3 isoform X2 [Pelobates cultripes]
MPLQGMWWWICCRHGFTLLGRDYGEKEEEEESFEMKSASDVQICSRQGTLDVGVTQPVHVSNGSDRLLHALEEKHSLITQPDKVTYKDDQDVIVKGWLQREVNGGVKTPWSRLKKFWFVLTPDSLDYYNSNEKSSKRVGSLVLTSLCSVIWPSKQSYKETGYWNVTVYGRKHCYRLYTEHLNEAVHWVCAIQKVIDSKAPLETPTQLLIKDIDENHCNQESVDEIYKLNPILRHTKSPLYAPLLPFSYGSEDHSTHNVNGYTALRDEAVKIFNSLQQMENERDPIPLIQGVLQTCLDLRPLRDEVYCQVIKQTTDPPEPGSLNDLRYWQLLTCMSCTYLPSPAVLRFLHTHLQRTQELFPGTEMEKYAEFILASLDKTKQREFVPSYDEISVLINREELSCMVYYPGAGTCKVQITSHTTAEELVQELTDKLNLSNSHNVFALYEQNSHYEQALSKATIIADTLTRFENLSCKEKGFESRWRLYFKLYCFLNIEDVAKDSLEYSFLFEQAHEAVIRGYMPTNEDTLHSLAALRLQFLNGDFSPHAPFPRLEELFPIYILHSRILSSTKPSITSRTSCTSFQKGIFSKALPNGLWNNSLEKQKAEESQKFKGRMKEESANMMSAIVEKWKVLHSMQKTEVMTSYLSIVKQWSGYGSTLFDIDFYMSSSGSFFQRLWLGISASSLCLYKQGEMEPFENVLYSQISSFGVSDSTTFKVSAGEKDMIFETTKVDEITQLINTYLMCISNGHCSTMGSNSVAFHSQDEPVHH